MAYEENITAATTPVNIPDRITDRVDMLQTAGHHAAMNLNHIHPDTAIFPNARPITHEGGPTAVLLLHGWTGYTGRLATLARSLADSGFTVRLPRLPGHGTNITDFLESGADDWLRKALDEYLELRERKSVVYVAGASMGAILSILLAARFPIPRIALLAPAVLTRSRILFLAPLLRHIVPRIPGDWNAGRDPDPEAGPIGAEYKTHNYTHAIAELYRLQKMGQRALPLVQSDTLVIASKKDETVPAIVADYVTSTISSEVKKSIILEESGHQMVQGPEGNDVCAAVVGWFSHKA